MRKESILRKLCWMLTMKKSLVLLRIGLFLLIIVIIPFVQQVLLGQELRQPPGFVVKQENLISEEPVEIQPLDNAGITPQPEKTPKPMMLSEASRLYFESDYGYYEHDQWVEDKCGFYITTSQTGNATLRIYYPFEITGKQVGHIFVDGHFFADFTIKEKTFELIIPCMADQKQYIQINSDFAQKTTGEDKRALAFVLQDIAFTPDIESTEQTIE